MKKRREEEEEEEEEEEGGIRKRGKQKRYKYEQSNRINKTKGIEEQPPIETKRKKTEGAGSDHQ